MSHTGGSLAQDLASATVLPGLGKEYLERAGFKDTEIFTMCHSMLGRYPYDPARAFAVLNTGPMIAAMAGLQEVCIMTIDEAHEIPRKDHNAASLRSGKMIINLYKGQKLGLEETEAVKTEAWIHELETRAIIDKVLELGDGDIAIGTVRATETGVLDMPFSGSRHAARRVLGVRDAEGAQRFLDPGNMPFGKEIMEFHQEKIAERAKKQRREISYEAVIQDLISVSEGQLISG
jgi:methylaspartate mutase epsilon subunit